MRGKYFGGLAAAACALAATMAACGGGDTTDGTGGAGGGSGAGGATSSPTSTATTASGGSGGSGRGPCAALEAMVQQAVDEARTNTGAPGASLSVSSDACTFTVVSGDSTPGKPMEKDMLLRVGSITKSYVAAAILELVEADEMTLDDPLELWVKDFPNGENITVKMLLNHTSGIFNYTEDDDFTTELGMDPGKKWTPEELVAIAAAHPPYFEPGQGWEYSNSDYILLGLVAEAASGKALAPLLHATVLAPAHLGHTFLASDEAVKGELAHGWYQTTDLTELFDTSSAWAAGAMAATTADTASWARTLWGGKLLDATRQAELVEAVPTGISGEGYGFATIVMDPTSFATTSALGHNGAIPGYLSWAVYFPGVDASFACTVTATPSDLSSLDALVPAMATLLGAIEN